MAPPNFANPWLRLPSIAPFVLPDDRGRLEEFNAKAKPEHRYDLCLYPDPFFGADQANVVFLLLNPGLDDKDRRVHSRPAFADIARKNLSHGLKQYPFLYLHPVCADTPGGAWWRKRARSLIEEDGLGLESVANGIACIQFMPYHSAKYSSASPSLPSQQYGFKLVRDAIAREAEIVVMRSERLWLTAVPELATYPRLHAGRNPRAPFISPGNLPSSYNRIVQRLRHGD